MRRVLLISVLAMVAVFAVKGCIFDPSTDPPIVVTGDYKEPTSPENVLNNLIVSYQRREIEPYGRILHKDFIFRFQTGDEPPGLGRDFWTQEEDSTGTAGLFGSPEVSDIFIDLSPSDADSAQELDLKGTMKIRVSPMKLTVDDVNGTTWLVEGDIQDMFFVPGDDADSTNWYLLEWRDIKGSGAPGVRGLAEADPGDVRHVSWGELLGMER